MGRENGRNEVKMACRYISQLAMNVWYQTTTLIMKGNMIFGDIGRSIAEKCITFVKQVFDA